MSDNICPYLGLKKDSKTVISYPSSGNYCYHARPIGPISNIHQNLFCLNENYNQCSVYQSEINKPLPSDILREEPKGSKKVYLWGLIFMGILTVGIIGLFIFNSIDISEMFSSPKQNTPVVYPTSFPTEQGLETDFPSSSLISTVQSEEILTQASLPSLQGCEIPKGWQVYIIKPTDSLLRLALLYHVTIEELQAANCLGNNTLIKPGQQIYVPLATPTPMATFTSSPTSTRTRAPVIPTVYYSPTPKPTNPPAQRPTNTATPVPPPTDTPLPPTPVPTATDEPTPTAPPL